VLLALVRLYLGWYMCDRLISPTIFYEESGWYDGQTWTKPSEVLQRLIVTYKSNRFSNGCEALDC